METAPPQEDAPATVTRPWQPSLRRFRASTLGRVVGAYGSTHTGSHAAGLAFNAVMSMFPMILGALAIVGWVVNGPGIQKQAQTAILRAFPGQSGIELNAVVTHDLHHYAGLLGIAGIVGLLWGVTNFFGSLEFCLSRIFDFPQRSFLRRRAMGAVMMFVLVAGLLIAVASNTLMNLVPVMAGIGPVAGFVAMAALTLIIYRLVPNRTFRLRQLWPGALVSGALIELITLLFPLYAKLAHGFDTYGQSLALFFLLATWLFFLSEFILIGALWNRVRLGEEFTASGLLSTREAEARSWAARGKQAITRVAKGGRRLSRATNGRRASAAATRDANLGPPAPDGDDAVAAHPPSTGDDSMTGDVATITRPVPRHSRRARTTTRT